jgi:phage/plasmid-associated DNA primase
MPRFRDTSFGLTRRILILSFDQTFKGARDDKELKLKLRAELPGIFQWALTGYSDLMSTNEFVEPPKMAVIMDSFKTSGSLVAQFLEERCRYAPHLSEWKSSIRKAFVDYCHDSGYSRVPATAGMWTDIGRFAPIKFARRQTRRGNRMDLAVHGIEILTGGMDGVEYEDVDSEVNGVDGDFNSEEIFD